MAFVANSVVTSSQLLQMESVQYRITDEVTTDQTIYTALTGDPGGLFVAPMSGKVWVHISCAMRSDAAGIDSACGFELRRGPTVGVGTVIQAANDDDLLYVADNAARTQTGIDCFVAGLTPKAVYNVRLLYKRVGASSIARFYNRLISVRPA